MNWIIYNRVSTEEQSKSGVSLDYQKASCLKFTKNNWIKVDEVHIFQETYSWAEFDRPQMSKIFEIIKSGEIDCIVLLRRDRLARSISVFNRILDKVDSLWVKIFYCEEMLTWDESMDSFMGNTLVGFSEYEKAMILKRTSSWKTTSAKAWKWITQVPYWYIKTPDKLLELYEPEVKIIKLVVDLYLNEKLSITKIVDYLNKNSILPPSRSEKKSATQLWIQKRRKNSVSFWGFSSVVTILDNVEKYYLWEYKAFSTIYKLIWKRATKIWTRSEEDIVTIKIPKIYTKIIAKQIAEKRRLNKNLAWKKTNRTYLLKGKLFCDCQPDLRNFTWYTGSSEKKLKNYRCSMSDKRKTSEDRRCTHSISWLKIDNLVIDVLKDFFLDFNKFKIEYWLDLEIEEKDINIIEQYKLNIHKLEKKEKRALNFALDWIIEKDELKEIKSEIKNWIKKYKDLILEESDLIYNEYKKSIINWEVQDYTKALYNYALDYFNTASYEELKEVVDMMIEKVIVPKDKSKPVRIILNVYPWDFDMDEFLNNRSTSIVREYNKEKNQLGDFQVEFSPALMSDDYKPTDWWDFKFINLLKKSLGVNGIWWTHRATIPGPIA